MRCCRVVVVKIGHNKKNADRDKIIVSYVVHGGHPMMTAETGEIVPGNFVSFLVTKNLYR